MQQSNQSPRVWAFMFLLFSPLPWFACFDDCTLLPWPAAIPGFHWVTIFFSGSILLDQLFHKPDFSLFFFFIVWLFPFILALVYYGIFYLVFSVTRQKSKEGRMRRNFWIAGIICLIMIITSSSFIEKGYSAFDIFISGKIHLIQESKIKTGLSKNDVQDLEGSLGEMVSFAFTKQDLDFYLSKNHLSVEKDYLFGGVDDHLLDIRYLNSEVFVEQNEVLPLLQRFFIKWPLRQIAPESCLLFKTKLVCYSNDHVVLIGEIKNHQIVAGDDNLDISLLNFSIDWLNAIIVSGGMR